MIDNKTSFKPHRKSETSPSSGKTNSKNNQTSPNKKQLNKGSQQGYKSHARPAQKKTSNSNRQSREKPSKIKQDFNSGLSYGLKQDLQQVVKDLDLRRLGVNQLKEQVWHNPRFQAALAIKAVLEDKKTLTLNLDGIIDDVNKGFVAELAYGVLRYLPQLNYIANKLLAKPFEARCYFAHLCLLGALYQLIYLRQAEHAAVYENVELVKRLYGAGVSTVVNACLRNFLRQDDELIEESQKVLLMPNWLHKELSQRVPEQQYQAMVQAMNTKAPLWLRINPQKTTVQSFTQALNEAGIAYALHEHLPQALCITSPLDVKLIPGYNQGWFSVQDLHAQLAGVILAQALVEENNSLSLEAKIQAPTNKGAASNNGLQPVPLIVDTCCSPGGKTTHLLEMYPQAQMIATDIDAQRLTRVHDNLSRLEQQAQIICADARYPEQWLPKAVEIAMAHDSQCRQQNLEQPVDLMLLDIPCSGTGVIRRHPDIKWLRSMQDIERLSQIQYDILTNSWQYVAVGGKLLYVSCSIMGQENEQVIQRFLAQQNNVAVVSLDNFAEQNLDAQAIVPTSVGLQLINQIERGDGFYYCLLTKTA
ncbi:16S rRNA (cytosine(967)-C(5))-methyltransferase RsmB [Psittacicella hinzii]|uniref:16S rRNA (Cytosine(967)-C(5))-methyltransferase n=1 Tax=Psittacicella hinzii TaxID=2028575 RepID=A0A3A1YWM4_9GAMM|nr:16S rRNA (cytosine(967)-C(5))-methyltransferase RsmB [Psittacicella hinzii]RIY40457.1 16S rRNA (cytosine(967)-C(5))-methyltransferase [Psittacicella hinzii]